MRNYVRSSMEKEHKSENGWWRNELLCQGPYYPFKIIVRYQIVSKNNCNNTYSIWIHARQPCWINKPTSQHKKVKYWGTKKVSTKNQFLDKYLK